MTLFDIILSATAIGLSSGGIAYTLYVVKRTPGFERPTDTQIRRMIDTAPRGKFDNALAR
jgi:hypothetical protein